MLRYLGMRVRGPFNGFAWSGENGEAVRRAREELNIIIKGINQGHFVFREVFPNSKMAKRFTEIEVERGLREFQPGDVPVGAYLETWLDDLRENGTKGRTPKREKKRVTESTVTR
jgi:hypothetical protein